MTEPGGEQAPSSIRIGTAERNAALKALDAHLEAGRLDAMEYGDRSAHVAEARTADEIRPLFTDLPAPHPSLPGDPRTGEEGAGPAAEVATTSTDRSSGGGLQTWGPRVAAVMPILALVLFLAVPGHFWWFFLLVPAAGMLLGRSRDGHRDRHDEPDGRRREIERDERD